MKIPRQEITLTTLSNGLRLVHCHTPKAHSGIFGVAVRAGSADERPDEAGLAHFVEHTIFQALVMAYNQPYGSRGRRTQRLYHKRGNRRL